MQTNAAFLRGMQKVCKGMHNSQETKVLRANAKFVSEMPKFAREHKVVGECKRFESELRHIGIMGSLWIVPKPLNCVTSVGDADAGKLSRALLATAVMPS